MGCLQSSDNTDDFNPKEEAHEDEEKEVKPSGKLDDDDELPEMQINRLGTNNGGGGRGQTQTIQVTQYDHTPNSLRRGQADQPSVLNNFQNLNASNNYDPNQYNAPSSHSGGGYTSPQSTSNQDSTSMQAVAIPEHRMMDSAGNVHVNKFYNVTRNHNLSNASKYTDMSEMPSAFGLSSQQSQSADHYAPSVSNTQHAKNLSINSGGTLPPNQYLNTHKFSMDSRDTGATGHVLWDDDDAFTERGSIMTASEILQ
mmetsp:Transcript_74760/g.118963  ORF Transcript_74760/g.118963 Transcript_74760/m.118963 type:complete len:255 (+) Transcript_74760:99-863(+)|eukprot:CAMPEP_0197053796 /NCGR_PEP_ID=MMETSP1384-20130603/27952_1 /TAXON_ID=29189 /ORGANISM="Ammonia sp." /LENGTH=254 /DNA_ID=CAMNT_0042486743 /DNA_START=99 /DNA_END=863 /DNA_ORIENTATION=-